MAITGGIVLGLYLRHRGSAAKQSAQQVTDPNAGLDALKNYSGFGVADPNAGMDNTGIISGLMQQNEDLLSLLLAGVGGGGGNPPATSSDGGAGGTSSASAASAPAASPTMTLASSSAGASPEAVPTTVDYTPDPPPADPAYPDSFYATPTIIDTGTQTSTGLPIQETPALAQGAEFVSAATSSTGGAGGLGYLLLSDKTLRPTPGVNVMM